MKIRALIGQVVLYLFIISSGLQIGAAAYETFVITPLWANSPPESVTNWNPVAEYAIKPGVYWTKGTVLYVVSTLLIVIFAWLMPKAQRNLMLIAGVIAVAIVIATGVYFVPTLMKTIFTRGAGYSGAEITQMVNSWISWNWLRFGAGFAAWLTAIRAVSLAGGSARSKRITFST